MSNDVRTATMAAWAAKDISARIDVAVTAKILGFAEHDIQLLMATRKLIPLGDPAPNAPKWFSAIDVIALAADTDWLNKATKEVSKYWRQKRARRANAGFSSRRNGACQTQGRAEKVSPNSSPKSSPSERFKSDDRAQASAE